MQATHAYHGTTQQFTDDDVQHVRKTAENPPRASVVDAIVTICGGGRQQAALTWQRISERHPEVCLGVAQFKFSGRGQRCTPVTDAEGIVALIEHLNVATVARQSAADVLVRHLGGDPSLVREVAPRQPDCLEPHRAISVSARACNNPPDALEIEVTRDARMKTLTTAFQLAQSIGSSSQERLRAEAQRAIDEILLPQGDALGDYVDSASILSERGYTEEQVRRLSGEFGRDLKAVSQSEGRATQSSGHDFGPEERQVGLYHRARDAALIEDVLASFRQRALHSRVLAGDSDPVAVRRQRVLERTGRGRHAASASAEQASRGGEP